MTVARPGMTEAPLIVLAPRGCTARRATSTSTRGAPVDARGASRMRMRDHARPGHARYLAAAISEGVLRARLGDDIALQTLAYGETHRHQRRARLAASGRPRARLGAGALEHGGRVWVASGDYKLDARRDMPAPFEPVRCHTSSPSRPSACRSTAGTTAGEVFAEINAWWQRQRRQRPRISAVRLRVRQGAAHAGRRRRDDRPDRRARRGRAA